MGMNLKYLLFHFKRAMVFESAILGGYIASNGGSPVTQRGMLVNITKPNYY